MQGKARQEGRKGFSLSSVEYVSVGGEYVRVPFPHYYCHCYYHYHCHYHYHYYLGDVACIDQDLKAYPF